MEENKPVQEEILIPGATNDKETSSENEVPAEKPSDAQQIPNEELAKLINSWFLNIRNVVRTVKEKDANLYKMNSELQDYRNGYSRQLFKSLAQNLINFREDCAKSLRDAEEYELKKESLIKYLGYVADDYETLLENIGVEFDGAIIKLNGSEINTQPSEVKTFPVQPSCVQPEEETIAPVEIPCTQQAVIELLDKRTEELKAILKDNSVLDTVVGEYIRQSQLIERNEQQIVLYPVIRALAGYYKKVKEDITDAMADSGAELSVIDLAYKNILGRVISETEAVLCLCQVTVENALADGDTYDPKRHRIMKFIAVPQEEAEKNGRIVKVYSDLYKFEDKVLYPAKVDVYKAK